MTGTELREWMADNRVQAVELARRLSVTQPRITALCQSEKISTHMESRITQVQEQLALEDMQRARETLKDAVSQ